KTRDIPYQVCRMVSEVRTQQIPVQTCRIVTETKSRTIPYCVSKQVPYTVTHRVARTVSRQEPYTVTRYVSRCVPRQIAYEVCRMVPVQNCCQPVSNCGTCGATYGIYGGGCTGGCGTNVPQHEVGRPIPDAAPEQSGPAVNPQPMGPSA
ncbi:MAG: hypothetical protein KDA58_09540, partial [Planctomycetaceae bacterium]|nr:hypothetical protein [Planctomycetaceae bacterium]